MKMTRIILAVLGLVVVTSAQNVSYNFDQGADFSKFRSLNGWRFQAESRWTTSPHGN